VKLIDTTCDGRRRMRDATFIGFMIGCCIVIAVGLWTLATIGTRFVDQGALDEPWRAAERAQTVAVQWLLPWEEIDERDREVDRRIFDAVKRQLGPVGVAVECERLRAELAEKGRGAGGGARGAERRSRKLPRVRRDGALACWETDAVQRLPLLRQVACRPLRPRPRASGRRTAAVAASGGGSDRRGDAVRGVP
jgi:hypothetical protein